MTEQDPNRQQRLYRERLATGIAELEAEIARLEAMTDQLQAAEKRDYDKRLAELHAMRTDARDQLYRMDHGSELNWEEFSTDLQQGWDNLRRVLQGRDTAP